jgi:adenine-specific DNA-methyltransferase
MEAPAAMPSLCPSRTIRSAEQGNVLGTVQKTLPIADLAAENPTYLTDQLITYIGNKRSLLRLLGKAIDQVKRELGGKRLRTLDAFSGSGIVSRLLKSRSAIVYSNDIEDYARVISECYLTNVSSVSWFEVDALIERLRRVRIEEEPDRVGLFERLYAPADEDNITSTDRVFYTKANARRLDRFRRILEEYDEPLRTLVLGPLLSEASVHANTAGVFKGFYKDRNTGIGRFGGTGTDALSRIKGPIVPQRPVLSNFECDYRVFQEDANNLYRHVGNLDLVYIDPPYNQHPYGSNYFMLNLLVNYREPETISRVSGIPTDWRRSDYNVRSRAAHRLADLVANLDSRYLLVSYNDEGFVSPGEMRSILNHVGRVTEHSVAYNAFRGSRNLRNRALHVSEHLFLVKKE